jgi:hypothetical protein
MRVAPKLITHFLNKKTAPHTPVADVLNPSSIPPTSTVVKEEKNTTKRASTMLSLEKLDEWRSDIKAAEKWDNLPSLKIKGGAIIPTNSAASGKAWLDWSYDTDCTQSETLSTEAPRSDEPEQPTPRSSHRI